ncbi:Putative cobalamin binding protein [Candidatus Methanomethylophilus alvi Mx1201]|jgi:corrinoid protein of di/trimethylamine methyltransferase|uniref:Dimethylamine methyltransferase n=2 Tax=Methanomethylophilus alvi TaxID=1291540 RepID=A0A3G3IFM4_9ARCH|nr:cobalamin-dependent protein [Methanomethylophilus alvi]AGI85178.1 Putative cobalamin binding protein [Candidatus Methanomethylophilus alvi Mx1201]AYQ54610.1 dimethylamine methyltransferase [Methanomethylophilus alvi]MCI5973887.1 cobalamin-dependent protein [Methanomethylophilus alvi]MDD7480396.1 cobalamin-dependent protein [Methanomethylophilus alvi]MDY7060595.1 cobalamin-dependent protein [Methanomethylophilus alvi]
MAGAEQKDILNDLRDSIIEMDFGKASAAARSALAAGMDPAVIIDEGLGKGMERISDEFNEGKIFLPQILAASMAMEAALQEITPVLEKNAGKLKGVIVMGSVQGDIHEIGKSVCCAMLRGAGYKVIDLGADVSPDKFIDAARENHADIIGASALMTTTLVAQKDIIRHIKEENESFKTAVGGAPCSQEWCDEIGADGYSASASDIVALVDRMLGVKRN